MKILKNVSLKEYNTFKVGGSAKRLIVIEKYDEIAEFLSENSNYFIIGNGSNVVFADEGYDGTLVKLEGEFLNVELEKDGVTVTVGAGAKLSELCLFAAENGLSGLEWAYGIPGTVGGAVFMNAGAYGGDISQAVKSSEVIKLTENSRSFLKKEHMNFGYRNSIFMSTPFLILNSSFLLEPKNEDEVRGKMRKHLDLRKSKQPLEYPSAGSFFKRPTPLANGTAVYAAKLIEDCGLKGLTVGGAQVSEKHAGFVVNIGNATQKDIETLGKLIREKVKDETGHVLEFEPIFVKQPL